MTPSTSTTCSGRSPSPRTAALCPWAALASPLKTCRAVLPGASIRTCLTGGAAPPWPQGPQAPSPTRRATPFRWPALPRGAGTRQSSRTGCLSLRAPSLRQTLNAHPTRTRCSRSSTSLRPTAAPTWAACLRITTATTTSPTPCAPPPSRRCRVPLPLAAHSQRWPLAPSPTLMAARIPRTRPRRPVTRALPAACGPAAGTVRFFPETMAPPSLAAPHLRLATQTPRARIRTLQLWTLATRWAAWASARLAAPLATSTYSRYASFVHCAPLSTL